MTRSGFDPGVRTAGADPDDDRWYSDWAADDWDEVAEAAAVEPVRGQNRVVKWVVWAMLALAIVLMLVVGYVGWWYVQRVTPGDGPRERVEFTVADDDTVDSVAARLVARGLVVDASVFTWYVDQRGGLELTPGYYELRTNSHMGDVLAGLRRSPADTVQRITFPEGFTLEQIANRLAAEQPSLSADEFLAATQTAVVPDAYGRPAGIRSAEGLLFPDTYQVSNADNEAQVVERMVGLMERVAINQEDLVSGAARLHRTPYEILIIASMIEKEAKLPEDRPKIARVIYNRMSGFIDMPLQIDATLYYGNDRSTPFPELRDIDSPYNTYMYHGLPPTPIASPGRAAIQAALNPAPNPPPGDPICQALPDPTQGCLYLYYVLATKEGGHAFAATYEQHEANIATARAAGVLP
ncbi:MAG TPA: endolytic transglycosylase MltG [Ilumatobacter sp.]|nr:endolytic transglycosylase MltG [Ilumatobacter sp.]